MTDLVDIRTPDEMGGIHEKGSTPWLADETAEILFYEYPANGEELLKAAERDMAAHVLRFSQGSEDVPIYSRRIWQSFYVEGVVEGVEPAFVVLSAAKEDGNPSHTDHYVVLPACLYSRNSRPALT